MYFANKQLNYPNRPNLMNFELDQLGSLSKNVQNQPNRPVSFGSAQVLKTSESDLTRVHLYHV